ncbi:autotransporter domain-containing protein [uncultured Rhodoblastus sp.]|uniref:autotransporter domain-containing protein n=1 Tax=uncultured Rhodoblastus sp. TaxID=543037 RepID=UPI0025F8D068|nr:autotransporter domain-containing protein [uncultured Rhodoblastus sp.]
MATALCIEAAWAESLNDEAALAAGGIGKYYDDAAVYARVLNGQPAGGVAAYFVDGNAFSDVVALTNKIEDKKNPGPDCTGTLIDARTILTAAHCKFDPATDVIVTTSKGVSQKVLVTSVYSHTGYRSESGAADIALLSLAKPVTGITPATLVTSLDSPPSSKSLVGRQFVSVGFGMIGTGTKSPGNNTEYYRLATTGTIGAYAPGNTFIKVATYNPNPPETCSNKVGTPDCIWGHSAQYYFAAQFQNLNSNNPAPTPNPNYFGRTKSSKPGYYTFEGAVAGGDSGGPLFVVIDGRLVEIGIVGGGSNPVGKDGQYGDVNLWTPLSRFSRWLARNNPLRTVTAVAGSHDWSDAAAWKDNATDRIYGKKGVAPDNTDSANETNVARYYNVELRNDGTITLDRNVTIDKLTVSGMESVLVLQTGTSLTTVLNTSLSAGKLSFTGGALVSPEVGVTGGVVTGNGTIVATGGNTGVCPTGVCNTGGVFAPVGTLKIEGNYTQGPKGTLSVVFGSAGPDKLDVSGDVTLGGALQVKLGPLTSPVKSGVTSTIVDPKSVTGNFSSVTTNLSEFISDKVSYEQKDVKLSLIRSASYASVADRKNQKDFANGLSAGLATETLTPDMNGILGRLDGAQTADEARHFFDQADADGGEEDVVGNQLLANLAANRVVGAALDRHLEVMSDDDALEARRAAGLHGLSFDYGRATGLGLTPSASDPAPGDAALPAAKGPSPAPAPGVGGWAQAIGGWQNLSGDNNAYGLSQTLGGFVGGVDINPFGGWDPNFKGGVAFSYLHGSLGRGSETGSTNAYSGYVYATQPFGRAYVEGRAGFGMTQMSTIRRITALGLDRTAYGSASGNDWSAALGAGYRFSQHLFNIEPSLHVAWDQVGRRAYTETGAGALNLAIENNMLNALQFSAGLRINANFALGNGLAAQPELRVRYAYDALNLVPATTASLVGMPGIPFTFEGVNVGRSAAVLGASLTVVRRNSVAVFADYNAELRQHETAQVVMGGVRIVW